MFALKDAEFPRIAHEVCLPYPFAVETIYYQSMTSQHNQEEMLHGSSRSYTPSGGPELGVFTEKGRGDMDT